MNHFIYKDKHGNEISQDEFHETRIARNMGLDESKRIKADFEVLNEDNDRFIINPIIGIGDVNNNRIVNLSS